MNIPAINPVSFSESRQERLQIMARYYETREDYGKNSEEIKGQKRRARILIGSCVSGGFLGVITYAIVKIMKTKGI